MPVSFRWHALIDVFASVVGGPGENDRDRWAGYWP